jgi:hypothetical protein
MVKNLMRPRGSSISLRRPAFPESESIGYPRRYFQLKPDMVDWSGMFFKLRIPGIRFLEVILLESQMSFLPYETAKSKLAL